tara:strand:+ start:220 stop:453 length:234 start_codon:yes stop_codon:yes gene_type:complete
VTESVPEFSEWCGVILLHMKVEAEAGEGIQELGEASETDGIHEEEGLREFIVREVGDIEGAAIQSAEQTSELECDAI